MLRLRPGTANLLHDRRISLTATDGARAKSGGDRVVEVAIPVRVIDSGARRVDHDGRLVFRRNRAQVTLDRIRVEGDRLTARVGGSHERIDVFTLQGGTHRSEKNTFIVENRTAKLTDVAARRLDDVLGVTVFRKGATVGVIAVT